MRIFARLVRDDRAGSAAEFALVLPLLIIFLFGIIDVGRFMWTCNRAEKATQMGVRFAVATDMIPNGLANYSFVVSGGLTQGDPIPQSSFGGASCKISGGAVSCTCNTGATCPSPLVSNSATALTAFNNVVARMRLFMPEITSSAVKVDYDYSGLGYAGDPNGSDVAPLVKVSILPNALAFRPITLAAFKGSINLPAFTSALTMEDGQGTVAN
ncbi:TadE/TadG family type IV pilus assembly protein [Sphingobium chungbukense]|nr:TadE family protein [Sphingobium chungbukense]